MKISLSPDFLASKTNAVALAGLLGVAQQFLTGAMTKEQALGSVVQLGLAVCLRDTIAKSGQSK